MTIAQSLLPEFDQEMASTRKLLALVPDAKAGYKPHAKSYTLGDLSAHMANLVSWVAGTLDATEIDLNPPGGPAWSPRKFESSAATLKEFDTNVAAAHAKIAKAGDADMLVNWSLKSGGQTLFTMPRIACLRSFVMNHLIHHRGQLTVYLRMCDVPLPQVYGPTADTPML